MASTAEDYGSELQELQWGLGSGSGSGSYGIPGSTHHIRTGAIGGSSHFLRSGSGSCYEAEDLEPISSSSSRHHHGSSSLQRGYYSPPGTSYTIVERPPSAPQHHSSHTTPYRTSHRGHTTTSTTTLGRDPTGAISPEQVLKLFGNGLNERRSNERRTPASSPASVRNASTQQLSNAQQSPPVPQALSLQELTVRTITMTRDPADPHHGFGICVKGGKDADAQSGVGVYISRVEEGSVAERAGLRPGDTILEVNGTPFRAVTHEEALKMLKSCRMLSMTVRGPAIDPRCRGGHPIYPQNRQQTCSWMDRQGRPASPPPPNLRDARYGHRTRKVDLCIEPGQSLGLMIRGGLEYGLGIYVTGVDKDSVADRVGLLVGDQILEVNGQSFEEATHDEAVQILKTNKRMSLLIRDVGKVPHSCTTTQPMPMMPVSRYQDHDSLMLESPPGNHRPPSPASISDWRHRNAYPSMASATVAMVEEKARVVLARSERAALSQLLADYRMRRINVEELVMNLGDLLNTHEKLTLLTELREIVDSKDRPLFDDLVYRPRLSRRKNDRAHNSDLIVTPSLHELPDYDDDIDGDRGGRRHSSPGSSRNREYLRRHLHADNLMENEGSDVEMMLGNGGMMGHHRARGVITEIRDRDDGGSGLMEDMVDDEEREERSSESGGFGGWRNHIFGGLQRVKSWYWGARPLELAHKMSRSFDMQEAQLLDDGSVTGGRRHHSAQRLARGPGEAGDRPEDSAVIVPDHQGNLRIIVKKSKPTLGIAIEGGANTKHPLPRIINIHDNGAAYDAGGLEVGQLILEVDGHKVEGLHHQEVARLIAESFARRDRNEIEFLVVEAKKSNLEPKPTALIFLEA